MYQTTCKQILSLSRSELAEAKRTFQNQAKTPKTREMGNHNLEVLKKIRELKTLLKEGLETIN